MRGERNSSFGSADGCVPSLLDRHGVEACRKRVPLCESCCLLAVCPTGAAAAGHT